MDFHHFSDPPVEIQGIGEAHTTLLRALAHTTPDPTTPSRLAGWTVGHVLTHIEHNATGYRSVLAGRPQYPSYEARDRAIDAQATRPFPELCAAMSAANADLIDAFNAETDFGRTVQLLVRPTQPGLMTLARRREIEVHHLDLDIGRDPSDIDRGYIERDAAMLSAWWEAKHQSRLPAAVASMDTARRWLWLVGRTGVDGVEPAGLF